jgi:uncharacterized repeat protein (TIGR03803 family)
VPFLRRDAKGDLIGTAAYGATYSRGSVFEIAKTATGYYPSPGPLVSFAGLNGGNPAVNLIADANGDLFGTTSGGGPSEEGTVFELVNTAFGYSLQTLATFNGADGANPSGSLITDANGDLFGTTLRAEPMATAPCSNLSGRSTAIRYKRW